MSFNKQSIKKAYKNGMQTLLIIMNILVLSTLLGCSQRNTKDKISDKPLYRDPVFDGAADPKIIWNRYENKWFMFYTNRRANIDSLDGVSWVHGTRIGIAESDDGGATWT
jgi:hypothetical protein